MQAACWFGRGASAALGGVAAHLYAEFDSSRCLDRRRLREALDRLSREHPMLCLRVSADGEQWFASPELGPRLEIDDFSSLSSSEQTQSLLEKRRQWTHQQLDLGHEAPLRCSVSLLSNQRFRLHLDADMIAIDPSSFRLVVEDLACFYEDLDAALPPRLSFFEWQDRLRSDVCHKADRERSRLWWRSRLPHIAPAPTLPLQKASTACSQSHRLSAWLTPDERQSLQDLAREHRLTLSSLMLGVFADSLGRATGDQEFRLNVPTFWREPLGEGVDRIVGEFANLVLLNVDLREGQSIAALCQTLGKQLMELLSHSSYSGVNLMRDLSRHHGSPQMAPVVFTAAVDLSGDDLFSERAKRCFGAMNWVISQGPQVALDAQVVRVDGGVLVNWDVRLDALAPSWVEDFFAHFLAQLRQFAAHAETFSRAPRFGASLPSAVLSGSTALTALQRAYLLGRTSQLPLGGVAMQEFREYHGVMDVEVLRSRLTAMVLRHPSLRTVIDAQKLQQSISEELLIHLTEIDLRAHAPDSLEATLCEHRQQYAHAMFDLRRSPWNVTVFVLPSAGLRVFARFDALILDGRGIAALMNELIEGQTHTVLAEAEPASHAESEELSSSRRADAQYWKTKLGGVGGPPKLPWIRSLEQLGSARFERQSLTLPSEHFSRISKHGARQGLFKNSVLVALVLEVLSYCLEDGDLCVALPVSPLQEGRYANHSSFIAVNWRLGLGSLLERAKQLQQDVLEGLQHLSFSGVDLARFLYERRGIGPALPVVVTNGLSWPAPAKTGPMHFYGGLTQTPQVAMDVRFTADADGALVFDIDYAREAVEPSLVQDILGALERAILQISRAGVLALDDSPFCEAHSEPQIVLQTKTSQEDFLSRIAVRIFDSSNTKTALISGERKLSYAHLGEGVARAIAALRSYGLRRGQVVAICLPRSPEHTMLCLACALSGLVWVPIDAQSPEERLRYLLKNCQPRLVVTETRLSLGCPSVSPEDLFRHAAEIPDLPGLVELSQSKEAAYYLYTSGSTGRPKCVVLSNLATAHVIANTLTQWNVNSSDVFISVTPLHHDMSVFDVFGCLSAGASLVLPEPGEEKDAQRWCQLVWLHRVTLWCSVPAILEMALSCSQADELKSLRLVAQGGDYIKPTTIEELRLRLPVARLISLGGPTETTIWSIWHEIETQDGDRIPYGRALPGNRYWLLNERGQHCPVGVTGRIHTSGVNLALGYLAEGQLNQQEFVTIRDEAGQEIRAFRTSDCARFRRDGVLMFEGRVQGYVKVRGVRVSLPDIEMELHRHSSVRQVLVVDFGDEMQGETCLGVLYVCSSGASLSVAALRGHAQQFLPPSHVPTRFLQVEQLPLSPNGKPDRNIARDLLGASAFEVERESQTEGLGSPLAEQILSTYLSVLGKSDMNTKGAMKLEFTRMGLRPQDLKLVAARLREAFCVPIVPAQLLSCRDVADVERLLSAAMPSALPAAISNLRLDV